MLILQSERVDFVQLMLDARETEVEGDLTMTEDDNEEGENTKAQKVNGADSPGEDSAGRSKGLTMEVCSRIIIYIIFFLLSPFS